MCFFLCMQSIAENQEQLKDPSISMGRRGQLERSVKLWKHAIQSSQELIVSFDSALQGESCRLKCPSSGGQCFLKHFAILVLPLIVGSHSMQILIAMLLYRIFN